jgi:hypothetical protein
MTEVYPFYVRLTAGIGQRQRQRTVRPLYGESEDEIPQDPFNPIRDACTGLVVAVGDRLHVAERRVVLEQRKQQRERGQRRLLSIRALPG